MKTKTTICQTLATRLLPLLLLLITGTLNAQKVSLHGDTIYKDGAPYALLKHSGPGLLMNYTLHELSGKEVARIIVATMPAANPKYTGEKLTYWTFDFFDKDLIGACEVPATNKKKLAELIVSEHLFDGGTLHVDAARFFIHKNGYQFTKPEPEPKQKD
jgi:hypothetical protein